MSASFRTTNRFVRGILGSLGNGNRRRWEGRDDWRTPRSIFDLLHQEFGFTLDACASPENALCGTYYSVAEDALSQVPWRGTVWCNPPYRSELIGAFVAAGKHSAAAGATVVMLVPVRADNAWWHEHALEATEIRFVRGRVRFGGMKGTAPFASAVLVFLPAPGGCVHVEAIPDDLSAEAQK